MCTHSIQAVGQQDRYRRGIQEVLTVLEIGIRSPLGDSPSKLSRNSKSIERSFMPVQVYIHM